MSARHPSIWYVEARPFRGTPEAPGEAPVDPASMGTAVLVELEHLDERDAARRVRRYLLTCAHVVRQALAPGQWWGPVHGEILCWPDGRGYTRTYAGRRSGEMPDVFRARVSALSPGGGAEGTLPDGEHDEPDDWVLLEIDDPAFDAIGAPRAWRAVTPESTLTIYGYPAGAGFLADRDRGHFWKTGDPVECIAIGPFRQQRTPDPGMLRLNGPDETRGGVSGGGVFDEDGCLVGIHRLAQDAALAREAIAATHIRDVLRARHRVQPTAPAIDGARRRRVPIAVAAVLALVAIAAGAAWWLWPAATVAVAVQGTVVDAITDSPIAGAMVNARGDAAPGTRAATAADGSFRLVVPVSARRDAPTEVPIDVALDGYRAATASVTVSGDARAPTPLALRLMPSAVASCVRDDAHSVVVGYFRPPTDGGATDLSDRVADALSYALLPRLQQSRPAADTLPRIASCSGAQPKESRQLTGFANALRADAFLAGYVAREGDRKVKVAMSVADRYGRISPPVDASSTAVDLDDPRAAQLSPDAHAAILNALAIGYEATSQYEACVDIAVASLAIVGRMTPELAAAQARCGAKLPNRALLP